MNCNSVNANRPSCPCDVKSKKCESLNECNRKNPHFGVERNFSAVDCDCLPQVLTQEEDVDFVFGGVSLTITARVKTVKIGNQVTLQIEESTKGDDAGGSYNVISGNLPSSFGPFLPSVRSVGTSTIDINGGLFTGIIEITSGGLVVIARDDFAQFDPLTAPSGIRIANASYII